jgi:transcriptional regulator with XRE-family HTH domain
MNNIQVVERIKTLAKEKNIVLKTMFDECNISHNFFYDVTKNNQIPAVDKIERIADYLNCSVDYLLGRTNIVGVINVPNEIIETIKNKCLSDKFNFKHFIDAKAIIQKPLPGGKKIYFVKEPDFEKILEIYNKAAEYKGATIVSLDKYKAMFKYSEFKILGYDASGYSLTPANYRQFCEIYDVYVESCAVDFIKSLDIK